MTIHFKELSVAGLMPVAFAASLALPSAIEARVATARCAIETGNGAYRGPCRFQSERGGTFTVDRADEAILIGGVTMITVAVIEPGVANVRGLTIDGVNSRWGGARRSSRDRACWIGSDFRICAY